MFIFAGDELDWGRIVITVISFAKEGRNMKYTPDAVVFPGRNNDALLAALLDEARSSAFFCDAARSFVIGMYRGAPRLGTFLVCCSSSSST